MMAAWHRALAAPSGYELTCGTALLLGSGLPPPHCPGMRSPWSSSGLSPSPASRPPLQSLGRKQEAGPGSRLVSTCPWALGCRLTHTPQLTSYVPRLGSYVGTVWDSWAFSR